MAPYPMSLTEALLFDQIVINLSLITHRYNTQGLVTAEEEVVEMENAVLRNYGNGTASLTTYLDSPTLDRGVGEYCSV